MRTILIVEDEPLELQALVKLVRSYGAQIKEILQASDSCEALALVRACSPDIILMDINIPGRSGLEVAGILRSEGYTGIIIMTTAYDYFEYAQVALRADVQDYLLKPIDRQEIYLSLQKAFAKLELTQKIQRRYAILEERMRDISDYLQPIVLHSLMHSDTAQHTMRTLFDWPPDGKLQAFTLRFVFENTQDADELKCFYYDFCSLCRFQFSVIASIESKEAQFVLQSLRRTECVYLELVLWCIVVRMRQLLHRRRQTCVLTVSPMILHYHDFTVLPSSPAPHFPPNSPLKLTALQSQIRSSMRVQQSKAVMRFKAGSPDKAVSVFKTMISSKETQWAGLYGLFSALLEYDPMSDVLAALRYVLDSRALPAIAATQWLRKNVSASTTQDASPSGFIIESALRIIQEDFCNPLLSQADIAEQLGLSQAYFSRLFKKEVGETFIFHLTLTRLSHAKKLLDHGQSLDKIAEACGYQSKKYFLDAFRRHFGISVTQYLEEGGTA